MSLRSIGRSTFGAAVLVTVLTALPGTAVASTPAPPPPAPSPAPSPPTRALPGQPAAPGQPDRPRERPQVVVPQGAPETGGGHATTGTDGLDAGVLTLGALGLAGAAGAAGVAVRRRRRDTTRA